MIYFDYQWRRTNERDKKDTTVLQNFINGAWENSSSNQTLNVPNPATNELLTKVPVSTREDVNSAVAAAKEAFNKWKKVPVPKRARILFKYHSLLSDNHEALAKLIVLENGKAYKEAHGEVQRGIECVEFASGAPTLMMGKPYQVLQRKLIPKCSVIH